jgi:hypothetical protein
MKHVILNLTAAEAEALSAILNNAMEARIPFSILVGSDHVRAAYRAVNKLQDAIRLRQGYAGQVRDRVPAGRRPKA